MQQLLHGDPRTFVATLQNLNPPAVKLQEALKTLVDGGHTKKLEDYSYHPPPGTEGHSDGACYLLKGNFGLTLESPEVSNAAPYLNKADPVALDAFVLDQKRGAACIKAHVTVQEKTQQQGKKGKGKKGQVKTPEQQQAAMEYRVMLHVVALLHWRLQHVQGLPLAKQLAAAMKKQEERAAKRAAWGEGSNGPQKAMCSDSWCSDPRRAKEGSPFY
jgi:hypothetical protein